MRVFFLFLTLSPPRVLCLRASVRVRAYVGWQNSWKQKYVVAKTSECKAAEKEGKWEKKREEECQVALYMVSVYVVAVSSRVHSQNKCAAVT